MTGEREAIAMLRDELTALLDSSDATPGCKTIASLAVAAAFARRTDMPPEVGGALPVDFWAKGRPH